MMNNNDNSNLLNALSVLLAMQNLQENREQTAYNDVQAANDRQAEYLLTELNKKFDEQNAMIKEVLERVKNLDA